MEMERSKPPDRISFIDMFAGGDMSHLAGSPYGPAARPWVRSNSVPAGIGEYMYMGKSKKRPYQYPSALTFVVVSLQIHQVQSRQQLLRLHAEGVVIPVVVGVARQVQGGRHEREDAPHASSWG
jgi:hypothetical protein